MHGDMNQAQRESVIRRLRPARWRSWWPPTSPPAAWTWSGSATSSTTTSPTTWRPTSTASAAPAGPGAAGVAMLFITPRERRMMREIERYTGARIKPMKMPTRADVAARRIGVFKDTIRKTIAGRGSRPLSRAGRAAGGGRLRHRRDRRRRRAHRQRLEGAGEGARAKTRTSASKHAPMTRRRALRPERDRGRDD